MTTSYQPRRVQPAAEWDEADLLRAAGVINEMISGFEWIAWRCIALELIDQAGSQPAAYNLAYAALRTYLAHLPVEWSGEQGNRLVRLRMTMNAAMVSSCPTCLADPGQVCIRMQRGKRTKGLLKWPHPDRAGAVLDQRDESDVDATWQGTGG